MPSLADQTAAHVGGPRGILHRQQHHVSFALPLTITDRLRDAYWSTELPALPWGEQSQTRVAQEDR